MDQSQRKKPFYLLKQSQIFIEGVKNKLFKKERMPNDRRLLAIAVGGQDTFIDYGQKGKYCTLSWKVQNQS